MEAQKSLTEDGFLWGLVILALVLGGGYYFFGLPFLKQTQKKQVPPWLFEGVAPSSFDRITHLHGGDTVVEFVRENGRWAPVIPADVRFDTRAVNRWVQAWMDPKVLDRFKVQPGQDYGIDRNATRIRIRQGGSSKQIHTLHIGGQNSLGSGFYLQYGSGGQAPVFLLATSEKNRLVPGVKKLRYKELFQRQPGDVQGLVLSTGSDSVSFRRTDEGWQQTWADTRVLNDTETRNLRSGLRSTLFATASNFYDTMPPAQLRPYRATVRFDYGGGSETLRIGGEKNGQRLVHKRGWPVVSVSIDPVDSFQRLGVKPSGWPEPISNTGGGMKSGGQQMPGGMDLKSLGN